MMLRGLMFLGFFLVVVVVLVVGLVSLISDVGGTNVILLILAAPFVLLSAAGLIGRSFILSWRPVRQLIKAAGSLADGDYSVRVAPTSSRSMGPVVASFNDMARRLETADEQRRRLLADLGHELRTPLTVVRGEIEAMLDGVHTIDEDHLSMLLAEVEVMERLLEDLRTLSLLEAGALALYPEPTDLAALLHDVAESFRRRATENGINVVVTTDSEIGEIALDQVRMREVLVNLVNNSIRAMPAGGDLHLGAQPAGTGAVITVTDAGCHHDLDSLHLLERQAEIEMVDPCGLDADAGRVLRPRETANELPVAGRVVGEDPFPDGSSPWVDGNDDLLRTDVDAAQQALLHGAPRW